MAPVPPLVAKSGVISVSAPTELKLDVAVAPKYAPFKDEKMVEEALLKFCNIVHTFVCPKLSVAVIVPEVVTGVEPMVSVEFESERPTDVTLADEVLQEGHEMVYPEPPTIYPAVPEVLKGDEYVIDEVATLVNAFVPLP